MRRSRLPFLLSLVLLLVACQTGAPTSTAPAVTTPMERYARSNLKVLKGSYLTWVNWQAAPEFIPVGTKLEVTGGPQNWDLVDKATGRSYALDAGAPGETYLEKFVTAKPPSTSGYSEEVKVNVKQAVARVGMTKPEVYAAMGAPTTCDGNSTQNLTYDQVMAASLWVWRRKRFGKNIGVEFDPATGKVKTTEGIWR